MRRAPCPAGYGPVRSEVYKRRAPALGVREPPLPAGKLPPRSGEAAPLGLDVLLGTSPDLLGPPQEPEYKRPHVPLCLLGVVVRCAVFAGALAAPPEPADVIVAGVAFPPGDGVGRHPAPARAKKDAAGELPKSPTGVRGCPVAQYPASCLRAVLVEHSKRHGYDAEVVPELTQRKQVELLRAFMGLPTDSPNVYRDDPILSKVFNPAGSPQIENS